MDDKREKRKYKILNKEIRMNLTVDKVNKFCAICDGLDYDVNVICGRLCVDGKSVMGVMEMCGRTVTLAPVTNDQHDIHDFLHKMKELGAYETEGFYS